MRITLLALVVTLAASPAAAQKITVKSATPSAAAQGSVNLDVLIDGSGFGGDSVAQFHVSGTTNPGGIRVNRTTRLSNSQLIANIDVDDAALLSYFDVKVVSSGRTGKGTDLFQVIQKNGQAGCDADVFRLNPPIQILPATRTSLTCGSDGLDCLFGTAGLTTRTLTEYALVMDSEVDALGRILVLATGSSAAASGGDEFYVLRFTADGAIDQSYGTGGVAHVAFTSATDLEFPQALAVQPDGAAVVVGSVPTKVNTGSPRLAAVARFRPDGTVDPAFANGGRLTFSFGSSRTNSWGFAVAIQQDGRILVAGTADVDFAAARLTTSGAFDASFGSGGRAVLPIGTGGSGSIPSRVGGVVFQDSGAGQRIVIAGDVITCTVKQMALVRLDPNGAADTGFGARGDGRVFVDLSSGVERTFAAAVDSAQRILLAGQSNLDNHSGIVRLQPDGLPDQPFGSGGGVRVRFDGLDTSIFNMTIDADDRIIATGGARVPGTMESDAFALRLQADGTLDSAFASNGSLLATFPVGTGDDQGGGVVVLPSGRIVLSGRATFNYVVLMGLLP